MRHLQTGTLLVTTLFTGLMAGLFSAFAYSVMPGLGRSSDHTLVEAMQGINKAIINPAFMLPFMGSIPLLGLAVALAWRGQSRSALPWLIAALVLYLMAFVVTSAVNVPLNDKLAQAGDPDHIRHLARVRSDFEGSWVAWNVVRALLHTAAFGCLTWSLVLHGAHRAHDSAGGGTSLHTPAHVMEHPRPGPYQHPGRSSSAVAPPVEPVI
ncbi:anthrone oxygenase family protein [Streptomyces lancefieldiae]|uniref:Anthrone oxygenase family protein n=1 Tax=Streptomyces lancefieldiae TaxID=3075520 RepID=A0ABU3AQG1_9ACTN|nr:anthrone oxygenase family protein [Streptomyces sp. DSM 40712]MDT0612179.1 anthrone oxygenase family protein [Streptomyces sp. DSM 40712]